MRKYTKLSLSVKWKGGSLLFEKCHIDQKNSKFRTNEGRIALHHQGKQSPRTEAKRQRERHGERVQSQINTFPMSGMKNNCLRLGIPTKIVYVPGVPTVAQQK